MTNTQTPQSLRHIGLLLALCFSLFSANIFALDLQSAKAQGYVGEQANGYIGVVNNAPGVSALVSDINSRRKAEYQKIAQRNGTSLEIVEALAGKKAIQKTPANQYVRDPSGNWIRK
jgi:hypothetical protein